MLGLITISNGTWRELCYIVFDKDRNAVLIDPGENLEQIVDGVSANKLIPRAIINTHGHFDHIASVEDLKKIYSIPFYLHSYDQKLLIQANFYRKIFEGSERITPPMIDFDLKDHKNIKIGAININIIDTPGHTPGGVSILISNMFFCGDNLFNYKQGRTDLPGGDFRQLQQSLKNLLELPDDLNVFPGHGSQMGMASVKNYVKSL
jgi:hydroxyacylglutathione hydrolase